MISTVQIAPASPPPEPPGPPASPAPSENVSENTPQPVNAESNQGTSAGKPSFGTVLSRVRDAHPAGKHTDSSDSRNQPTTDPNRGLNSGAQKSQESQSKKSDAAPVPQNNVTAAVPAPAPTVPGDNSPEQSTADLAGTTPTALLGAVSTAAGGTSSDFAGATSGANGNALTLGDVKASSAETNAAQAAPTASLPDGAQDEVVKDVAKDAAEGAGKTSVDAQSTARTSGAARQCADQTADEPLDQNSTLNSAQRSGQLSDSGAQGAEPRNDKNLNRNSSADRTADVAANDGTTTGAGNPDGTSANNSVNADFAAIVGQTSLNATLPVSSDDLLATEINLGSLQAARREETDQQYAGQGAASLDSRNSLSSAADANAAGNTVGSDNPIVSEVNALTSRSGHSDSEKQSASDGGTLSGNGSASPDVNGARNIAPVLASAQIAAGASASSALPNDSSRHISGGADVQPGMASPSDTATQRPTGSNSGSLAQLPLPESLPTSLADMVKASRLYQRAGSAEMHIAMDTDLLGSIDLKAVMHQSTLTATIGVQRADVQTLLSNELPALQHSLSEQNLHVEQISILGGSTGSATDQGSKQQAQQQNSTNYGMGGLNSVNAPDLPSAASGINRFEPAGAGETTGWLDGTGRLSVHA